MSLTKWDPFRGFNALNERMGSLMGRAVETPMSTTAWNPSVDILENDNEVVIKAEVPGVSAKDIEVKLENNVLVLTGERRFEKETKDEHYHRIERDYGTFRRAFSLPITVNADKVTAECKDGLLRIVLPKGGERKLQPIKIDPA